MKKLTPKQKKHLLTRANYQLKRSKKSKKIHRQNRITATYVQSLTYSRIKDEKGRVDERSIPIVKRPHNRFSIIKDPINVINFIAELKDYAKTSFKGYKIVIELSQIERIDMGAICLLLSAVQELSNYKLKIIGNIPTHEDCRKLFVQSGFLSHVKTMSGGLYTSSTVKNKISILKRGKDRTSNKEVGETIKLACEMLTSTQQHYPPIYSIVQEINGNSVEHAYITNKKEHWMFAINYDEGNEKVIFAFADNGLGILTTLKRKFSQEFFDFLQLKSSSDILKGAFTKKYSSRHEDQINRNKGLPLVKKIQSQNEVKNLFVVSNDVFLYINSFESVSLSRNFNGTFYYWELDVKTINNWKKRIQQHEQKNHI